MFQHKDSSDEPSQSSDIDAKPQLSDEDSDDEDSDDPDKLWCICQQPHNDRYLLRHTTCTCTNDTACFVQCTHVQWNFQIKDTLGPAVCPLREVENVLV